MKEFLEAYRYCKENKSWTIKIIVITAFTMIIGAYTGTLAYYNGWLG